MCATWMHISAKYDELLSKGNVTYVVDILKGAKNVNLINCTKKTLFSFAAGKNIIDIIECIFFQIRDY